jgi:tetratricopeptide (TPR) repeat protein
MMAATTARTVGTWVVTGGLLLALGGASVGMLAVVDRQRPPTARAEELLYLPKGEYLRLAVLGYRQLAADLIWIKAVQHFGKRDQTTEGYLWAYHAVDVLTDLDPKFSYAYLAGGTILGVWANLVQESITLLTKGMQHNPGVWQLPFFVGYDYFYELRDYASASIYFRIAAGLPGAPEYLPRLAARMTAEAGDPEAALEFLERLYEQMKDERSRAALAKRIKEIMAERDIRRLEEAVRAYQSRFHKLPGTLQELVAKGVIREVPTEPLGGEYRLNPADGSVISTALGGRLKVYRSN